MLLLGSHTWPEEYAIEMQVSPSRLRLHVPYRPCPRGICDAGILAYEKGLLDSQSHKGEYLQTNVTISIWLIVYSDDKASARQSDWPAAKSALHMSLEDFMTVSFLHYNIHFR